jgi:urate oxidase
MALLQNSYGKGRVRVLRVYRDGQYHEPVRDVGEGPAGGWFRSYTGPDNSKVIATDSIKNIVNVVARENLRLSTEESDVAIAKIFLDGYPQVERVNVELVGNAVAALSFDGKPHGFSFTRVGNAIRSQKSTPRGLDRDLFWRRWIYVHEDDGIRLGRLRDG